MADHQANTPDEQEPVSTSPAEETPVASTDDSKALKAEMIKHRQEAARLREELEKAKASTAEAANQAEPPKAPPGESALERIERLERQSQLRDLMGSQGLNAKQADVVADLMTDKGLDATEARTLAALRDPDLFAAEGQSVTGFQAGVHGSTRPTAGSAPVVEDQVSDAERRQARILELKKTGHKKEAKRLADNVLGAIAARQVGRPGHELIPIPKT